MYKYTYMYICVYIYLYTYIWVAALVRSSIKCQVSCAKDPNTWGLFSKRDLTFLWLYQCCREFALKKERKNNSDFIFTYSHVRESAPSLIWRSCFVGFCGFVFCVFLFKSFLIEELSRHGIVSIAADDFAMHTEYTCVFICAYTGKPHIRIHI